MIYDAFSFFNELELLEVRLHELSDVVDKFVLVEATRTYTGNPKPLCFADHQHLFTEFFDKIIHVVVEDMPMTKDELEVALTERDRGWIESKYQVGNNWIRDRHQTNALMRALGDCDPDDIIIISDADEIVRASIIENIEGTLCEGSNPVEQALNSYYFNIICTNMPWWGSKIVRRSYLDDATPSEVRFHSPPTSDDCYIKNGGWHYNFFGGAERIRLKVQSYAHSECNTPDVTNLDNINRRLRNKEDVLGRLYEYEEMELTYNNTPKYVMDNLDKFDRFIYKDIL